MPLWDRSKKRGPSSEEQANWEELAAAERARRQEERKKFSGRRGDSKERMLDQMRRF